MRVARFQKRLQESGLHHEILESTARVYNAAITRNAKPFETGPPIRKSREGQIAAWTQMEPRAMSAKLWNERWQRQFAASKVLRHRLTHAPADTPPSRGTLKLHKSLCKAQFSLLVQMRTGHMCLRSYLQWRKVPGVDHPRCDCNCGRETPRHVVIFCPKEQAGRRSLAAHSPRGLDYHELRSTPKSTG